MYRSNDENDIDDDDVNDGDNVSSVKWYLLRC
jgi:hypothetical protein